MELVVDNEVEVSSGTDPSPTVGLEHAPDISEALTEQYLKLCQHILGGVLSFRSSA
jgi:hypothetical protein